MDKKSLEQSILALRGWGQQWTITDDDLLVTSYLFQNIVGIAHTGRYLNDLGK